MEYSAKYLEIVRTLELNMSNDKRAGLYLDSLIKKPADIKKLEVMIRGNPVIVYGAGPSLENDLNKITNAKLSTKFISIAADGAVGGLLRYKILPHINVTDLDGDIKSIMFANIHGTLDIVHAHSGNVEDIRRYVPKMPGIFYGSTQSTPTEKVYNFGGFTDGDRAVYLANHFGAAYIVLAGMDFGSIVGFHAGKHDRIKKPRSLKVGKMLIEDLAKASKTKIYNLTHGGEVIKNTKYIDVDTLKHMVGVR